MINKPLTEKEGEEVQEIRTKLTDFRGIVALIIKQLSNINAFYFCRDEKEKKIYLPLYRTT